MSIHNLEQGGPKSWTFKVADISDVLINNVQNGDGLIYDSTTQKWDNSPIGGGGEINTASNVGTGEDVFLQKAGTDLEFKRINQGTNMLIYTSANSVVVATTAELNTASNVGLGDGLFKQKISSNLEFKTLIAGSGIDINNNADTLEIVAQNVPGDISNAQNIGLGEGVFAQKTGSLLDFKSLESGNAITISSNPNEITIDADVDSGLWTPIMSVTNNGSGVILLRALYTQIKNTVTCSVNVQLQSLGLGIVFFDITNLPVAKISNFAITRSIGSGSCTDAGAYGCNVYVEAIFATQLIRVYYISTDAGLINSFLNCQFTYLTT